MPLLLLAQAHRPAAAAFSCPAVAADASLLMPGSTEAAAPPYKAVSACVCVHVRGVGSGRQIMIDPPATWPSREQHQGAGAASQPPHLCCSDFPRLGHSNSVIRVACRGRSPASCMASPLPSVPVPCCAGACRQVTDTYAALWLPHRQVMWDRLCPNGHISAGVRTPERLRVTSVSCKCSGSLPQCVL